MAKSDIGVSSSSVWSKTQQVTKHVDGTVFPYLDEGSNPSSSTRYKFKAFKSDQNQYSERIDLWSQIVKKAFKLIKKGTLPIILQSFNWKRPVLAECRSFCFLHVFFNFSQNWGETLVSLFLENKRLTKMMLKNWKTTCYKDKHLAKRLYNSCFKTINLSQYDWKNICYPI